MKKGFTLIELLAVIVILAIIALIVTPIILGIINDAREKANERSVELYASATKNAIAAYQLTNLNAPAKFSDLNVQYDGDIECATEELYSDGSFYIAECTVNGTLVDYEYGIKKTCKLEDKDGNGKASLSDIVTCGSESFYVMYNKNNEITMLSMYNLNVGDNLYTESTLGIQNENVLGGSNGYGTVSFANDYYWDTRNSSNQYIYNESTDVIYPYVSSYEEYLQENGVNSANAALISYQQLEELRCSSFNANCSSAPEWVYSTSYWTGSSVLEGGVWTIDLDGNMHDNPIGYSVRYGVRPVVTISTSEL